MKRGTRIRTTCRVFTKEGFLPPMTSGVVLLAMSANSFDCEFADVAIETGTGTKVLTVTATVLECDMVAA